MIVDRNHTFRDQMVIKGQQRLDVCKFVFLLGLIHTFSLTFAQQLPQYTLFSINPYIFNPAVAGTEDFVHTQASYRSQWSGFEGAPQTMYISAHAPMNKKTIGYGNHKKFQTTRWRSMGMTLGQDKTGPIRNTLVQVSYAYNMPVSAGSLRFSFGMNAGLKTFSYNPSEYLINIVDQNDQYILNGYTQNTPDIAAGLWAYSQKLFFGISAYQILNFSSRNFDYNPLGQSITSGTLQPHYFLMAGYKVDIHNQLFAVPSVLLKSTNPGLLSYDLNLKFVYRGDYWLGAAYRNQDAISFFAGLAVNKRLEISYSYDAITSSLYKATFGSNEILVGYRFMLKPKTICPDMFW